MVSRWSQKSPGLKILWLWTLGTTGVLITSVVTTRLRDMEKLMKEEDSAAARSGSDAAVSAPPRDEALELLSDE